VIADNLVYGNTNWESNSLLNRKFSVDLLVVKLCSLGIQYGGAEL